MGTTPSKTTNKQGKGKAQAAKATEATAAAAKATAAAAAKATAAAAAEAKTIDSNVNTTMLSLLLPTLPTLTEVNKQLNATFNEVVNGPFRLFDLFSAEFIGMKNKIATNKVEERSPTFGLSSFQIQLYAKLALSANKISLSKLEAIISQRNVDSVLQTSDGYQDDRLTKYEKDVREGKKRNKEGEIIPFHVFNKKAWSGVYFQKMLFLACEYPKKEK